MTPSLVSTLPTVKVGGKSYAVKYGHAALFLLSQWGIDIDRIFSRLNSAIGSPAQAATDELPAREAVEPDGTANFLFTQISAAGLGTVDSEGVFRSARLTGLELSELMHDDEAQAIGIVTWPLFAKKIGLQLEPKPAQTPAPNPPAADTTNNSGSTSGPSEPPNQA